MVERQPPVQDRRRVEPHRGEPDLPRVRQRPDRLHLGERLPQLRGQRQRVRRVRPDVVNTPTPSQTTGACPVGSTITGPVALYLQQAGVGGLTVEEAGTQDDHPERAGAVPPGQLEAPLQPDAQLRPALGSADPADPDHPDPGSVLRAVHRPDASTNAGRHLRVPRRRHDPVRLHRCSSPGWASPATSRATASRCSGPTPGIYYARIPGLNLASSRSTDGSRGQTLFRNSELTPILGPPPAYGEPAADAARWPLRARKSSSSTRNSRTRAPSPLPSGYEREIGSGLVAGISVHPRPDRSSDPVLQRQRPGVRQPLGLGTRTRRDD